MTDYVKDITADIAILLSQLHAHDSKELERLAAALHALTGSVNPMRDLTPEEVQALEQSRRDFDEGRVLTIDEADEATKTFVNSLF